MGKRKILIVSTVLDNMRSSATGVVSGSTVNVNDLCLCTLDFILMSLILFLMSCIYLSVCIHSFIPFYFCRDARKPVFRVSDQV